MQKTIQLQIGPKMHHQKLEFNLHLDNFGI